MFDDEYDHHTSTMTSTTQRILAGGAGVVLLVLAFCGFLAWSIADFYQIADQTHFRLAIPISGILLVLSACWVMYAAIGYRRWSVRTCRFAVKASLIIGVSGGSYVMWLLL